MLTEEQLKNEETKIFKELKANYDSSKEKVYLYEDGIFDYAGWISSELKPLVVLKEPNAIQKDGSFWYPKGGFKKWLRDNACYRKPTWDNVAKWIHGIDQIGEMPSYKDAVKVVSSSSSKKAILWKIAGINVRKKPGRVVSNDDSVYSDFVAEFKSTVTKQVKLYSDNGCKVIICCGDVIWNCMRSISEDVFGGRFSSFETKKYSLRNTHGKLKWLNIVLIPGGPVVVQFIHPQQRAHYSYKKMYEDLVSAVRSALGR